MDILILFLLLFQLISLKECDKSEEVFTLKKIGDNYANIFFNWNSTDCTNKNTNPIYNISNKILCNPGEYIDYDHLVKKLICKKCPKNSFSNGNSERYSEFESNFDKLMNEFVFKCKTIQESNPGINSGKCNSWISKSNGKYLQSGSLGKGNKGLIESFLYKKLDFDGSITFTYSKKFTTTNILSDSIEFIFGVDGKNLYNDKTIENVSHITKTFNLSKGTHSLYWAFINNFNNFEDNYILLTYIDIYGIYNNMFSCIPCPLGVSEPGSSMCSLCNPNEYIDYNSQSICVKCPQGTYSDYANIGIQSCSPIPDCSIFDYEIIEEECIKGMKKINFKQKPNLRYCRYNTLQEPITLPCKECNEGFFKNNSICNKCNGGYFLTTDLECDSCPKNSYSQSNLNLTYFNSLPSWISTYCINYNLNFNPCEYFKGWQIFNNSFVSSSNLQKGIALILQLNPQIENDNSDIAFKYECNCDKKYDNFFSIIINNEEYILDSNESNEFVKSLKKGKHTILISLKQNNGAKCNCSISNLFISNIRFDGSTKCSECPLSMFSNAGSSNCVPCKKGHARVFNSPYCLECPEMSYRDQNMDSCAKCPLFTYPVDDRTSCKMFDAYNISGQYWLNLFMFSTNNSLNTEFDTKKPFFGPLKTNRNDKLIYLSPTTVSNINDQNIDYEFQMGTEFSVGNVFALFYLNTSLYRSNLKILKNVGSKIQKIQMVNATSKTISIFYEDGDNCIFNKGLNFSSRLDLICSKGSVNFPQIADDSTDCYFHLIWQSIYACSQCRTNQVQKKPGSCINGKRIIYLEEGDNCCLVNDITRNMTVEETRSYGYQNNFVDAINGKIITKFDKFAITNQIEEDCVETYEMSQLLGYILLIVIFIGIFSICYFGFQTFSLRKKYREMVISRDESKYLPQIEDVDYKKLGTHPIEEKNNRKSSDT